MVRHLKGQKCNLDYKNIFHEIGTEHSNVKLICARNLML